MNQDELNKILEEHKKWLNGNGGKRVDLREAYLRDADLRDADLRDADLRYTNLREAYLRDADLRNADLRYTDLRDANLRDADLSGANIDFSVLPLWCGGLGFKIDERQAKQLMYHVINLMQYSELNVNKVVKKQMFKWLEDSHLVTEHNLPILEEK